MAKMLKRVQHDGRVECCVVLEYYKRTVTLNWFQGLFNFKNVMPLGLDVLLFSRNSVGKTWMVERGIRL